jgi:hypothetical protein
VFSHTDLGRKGDFPERFRRIAELADVVIIDEAHHFRNPGTRGGEDGDAEPSRYYQLYNLLDNSIRSKTLFMLTATPINNRLSDFRHMAELFTRRDEAYFARTLGVNNLSAHFNQMEKTLRSRVGHDVTDMAEQATVRGRSRRSSRLGQRAARSRSRVSETPPVNGGFESAPMKARCGICSMRNLTMTLPVTAGHNRHSPGSCGKEHSRS